ncbi:class I SAM-dependent methyltransferase [Roseibium sp. M-1]
MTAFTEPADVSGYQDRTARLVPGLRDLHRMAALLLSERVPETADILVLGAGGGLELNAFATLRPGWRFLGVDPSAPMLEMARKTLGPQASRVRFVEGTIDDAPRGFCDGASCLLTLHFLPEEERLRTLREVHRRLKPGAPLVVAHHSFPTGEGDRDRWLARYRAFAVASGVPSPEKAQAAMKERLPVLSPEQDADLLRQAGFAGVELFYAGLTFRGWVGYRN